MIAMAGISGMDQDKQEAFEELVGPAGSALERLLLLAARRVHRTKSKLSGTVRKRVPFLLPTRGPLSDLDSGIEMSLHVLSRDPLVLYVPIGGARPLYPLAALGRRLAGRRVTFLTMQTWTMERPAVISRMGRDLAWYAGRFPLHEIIFLCNTEEERRLVAAAGGNAIFSNHNLMVSEDIFRPLPDVPVEFDAVYNGRISPIKRHHLAFDIERLAHITYSIGELPPVAARAFVRRLQAQSLLHQIANPLVDGWPGKLTAQQVNHVYNQAAVGLCLSAVEGAMYSSMEYLMAGLPIVSTPSLGGRDVYFDPDYCIVADPEPAAIRRAVETLRDRAIPRQHIRRRTLEKVHAQRIELMAFLTALLRRKGSRAPPIETWPFPGTDGMMRRGTVREIAAFVSEPEPT
ncbi:hypothetical protein X770_28215 [Mesorhizobium sp. LSJC269B00]|nr:hypothetical protein X770_28215 [Mesorhizobium sp. LSJC269B00]